MRDSFLSPGAGSNQPSSSSAQGPSPKYSNPMATPGPIAGLGTNETPIRRKALVVDDVSDVTEMLAVLLSYAGYAVVTASSAPQALTAAHEDQFDVVISDIGMPGMNGYQLARELRQLPGYEEVPLVAVTGYSMFDDYQRSRSAGFNAHMTKPIDPSALLELIEQL